MNAFTTDTTSESALGAAAIWLERNHAEPGSVAVVTLAPRASVGIWHQGREHVGVMPVIDDPGAEMCDAAGSATQAALLLMPQALRDGAIKAASQGATLQLLLEPEAGEFALRLVINGKPHALVTRTRAERTH